MKEKSNKQVMVDDETKNLVDSKWSELRIMSKDIGL